MRIWTPLLYRDAGAHPHPLGDNITTPRGWRLSQSPSSRGGDMSPPVLSFLSLPYLGKPLCLSVSWGYLGGWCSGTITIHPPCSLPMKRRKVFPLRLQYPGKYRVLQPQRWTSYPCAAPPRRGAPHRGRSEMNKETKNSQTQHITSN